MTAPGIDPAAMPPTAASAPAVAPAAMPPAPSGADRPWIGSLFVPLQRLHGGPAAAFGLLAALLFARRGAASPLSARLGAALGILVLVGLTLAFGWQAAPGEAERDAAFADSLRVLLSADAIAALPGGGALAWAALLPAIGGLGIAAFAGLARIPLAARVVVCAVLVGLGIPLENPRLVAPVASVPPDPVRDALGKLDGGAMVVFPAPQWPYLQGQRPAASVFWEAAATGQRVEARGEDRAAAGLVGALTALTAVPVDIQAAHTLWDAHTDDALRGARAAGWRYLLVDLDAIPPLGRPRLDGWLAERAGMPVARDGSRLLYDLTEGPAGMGSHPPEPGGRPVPGTPGGLPTGGAMPAGAPPLPSGAMPPPSGSMPPPGGTMPPPSGSMPPPSGAMPEPSGVRPRPQATTP